MSKQSLPKYMLANMFAMAGLVCINAAQANQTTLTDRISALDNESAARIVQSLLPNETEQELRALLNAESIDDLTAEQQTALLSFIKKGANNLHESNKPIF
jgi:hypothetical protein